MFIWLRSQLIRGFLACAVTAAVCAPCAQAWPWNSTPQPLLQRNPPPKKVKGSRYIRLENVNDAESASNSLYTAIRADAGAPLAWDESSRILWFIQNRHISQAKWNGKTFRATGFGIPLNSEGGLLADSGLHFVYFLNSEGHLMCLRKIRNKWTTHEIGAERLQKLLGIDEKLHRVFAYDTEAKGVRLYSFDKKTNIWASEVIATGLGLPGDAGAVDSVFGAIYTTHESVDDSVSRSASAATIDDPGSKGFFKPWPLVAIEWDGSQWKSRVLSETGVPQQPAFRALDRSVFFVTRTDIDNVRIFRPKYGTVETAPETLTGYAGSNTFEDHDKYTISAPKYPNQWRQRGAGSNTGAYAYYRITNELPSQVFIMPNQLVSPIQIVPYYEPIWKETPIQPRLTHFRAVVNPKQNRLVQHRESYTGEVVKEQIGVRLAGYLYRDANGVLVRKLHTYGDFPALPSPFSQVDDTGLARLHTFGLLDPDFDPQNPPEAFAALSQTGKTFWAYQKDYAKNTIRAESSLNPDSPLISAYLRQPTTISLRTFGHDYASSELNQPGARYRIYSNYATSLAVPSSIAVDQKTGVTFYTQAPPNTGSDDSLPESALDPDYSSFKSEPDPKYPRPESQSVWIVMVY